MNNRDNIRFARRNLRNALIGSKDPTFGGEVKYDDRHKAYWASLVPEWRRNLIHAQKARV